MRILLVNKFIFPKGGAETYTFDVGKMLEEHGHEVQYFGLENEKNTVGNRIGSYVTNMDFSQGIKANLNAPFRIIYSREARKKIRAVLDDFQPDVVHLNNIQYHLTHYIILETNKWRKETKKECKIVYTTHDYQLVCPSHGMFDVNMKPCERCLDGHYIPNVKYLGFKTGEELYRIIAEAAISVCPSEWYENCPYSVMESVLLGTPVVGSKMGGIPELIEPGKTGELFEAGNVEDLMKAIKKVLQTQDVLERYTKNCSQVKYETTESYYIKLMKIYRGEKNVEQISS